VLSSKSGTSLNSTSASIEDPALLDTPAEQLLHAAGNNDAATIRSLLETHGEAVNVNYKSPTTGYTPLLAAAWNGHREAVGELLKVAGVDVNAADSRGYTPLLLACANGRSDVVRLLVRHPGVDYTKFTVHRKTALYLAAAHGRTEILRMLLRRPEVDLDLADTDGFSPLWKAAYYGKVETIKWMLASGRPIDIDQQSGDKCQYPQMTALAAAKAAQASSVADLLTEFKANPAQVRKNIRTELGLPDITLLERDFGVNFGAFVRDPPTGLNPTDLLHLNLSQLELERLPDTILNYLGLTLLDLSLNNLTSLPAAIGALKSLKELLLYGNQLVSLPDELC